jgi:peroxiredoxin
MPSTEGLRAGDDLGAAAQIALRDQHGKERRLAEFRGHGLVVYFYPADHTPGCTVEGREFRDLDEAFAALKCTVVGVSVDSVESHRAFAEKHAFPFALLSDPEGELASAFGVLRNRVAARSAWPCAARARLRSLDPRIASNARRLKPRRVSTGPEMMVILCSSVIDDK